jgi:hypothetical protein
MSPSIWSHDSNETASGKAGTLQGSAPSIMQRATKHFVPPILDLVAHVRPIVEDFKQSARSCVLSPTRPPSSTIKEILRIAEALEEFQVAEVLWDQAHLDGLGAVL